MFDSFTNKKFENRKFSSLNSRGQVNQDLAPDFKLCQKNNFILISGPTGVGKTDFVDYFAENSGYDVSIINGDMGQVYAPISIGTAKPECTSNCYLFNIVDLPVNFSVHVFRNMVIESLNKCWSAGKLPIIVGGSGFYMKSLSYPPLSLDLDENNNVNELDLGFKESSTYDLYLQLKQIDYERAKKIDQNDRYRIERALFLWKTSLHKPSELKPKFEPLGFGSCFYYYLTRDRGQLINRIDARVSKMFAAGWMDEVRGLSDSWKEFLLKKKLIGYPDIIRYLEEGNNNQDSLMKVIGCKTAQYAKRQLTFWRSLQKQLIASDPNKKYIRDVQEFDLTNNFECLKDIIVKKINES